MDKRTFLKKGFAASVTIASTSVLLPTWGCSSQPASEQQTEETPEFVGFSLPELAYPTNALEPHIDQRTMEIHHGRHHQGYVNNLNKAIEGTQYADLSIEQILVSLSPDDTAIRNNGGGHYNHTLFWEIISPDGGGEPTGELATAINDSFGSYEELVKQFEEAANSRFGSGWAWLLADATGKLSIGSTPNQDNPLMSFSELKGGMPIIGIDVWEHAYYLNYQNRRGDYVSAFWNIVDWSVANNKFQSAVNA